MTLTCPVDWSIATYAVAGFVAQMVDGALGMAYGVTSTSLLLALGVAPPVASASVHAAETVTTAVSGLSHLSFGNVERSLLLRLAVTGVPGAVLGAWLATHVPVGILQTGVSIYLLLTGLAIMRRAINRTPAAVEGKKSIALLGFAGGFLDAVGGGGWGPIVASTLVARGRVPRIVVGTVNLAEFFVTVATTAAFLSLLDVRLCAMVAAGLLLGGIVGAPLAAWTAGKLPVRGMMIGVGILIIVLSIRTLVIQILM